MRIYDCFSYWDEDLLLEFRLNILNDYVDYFVIVEGNKTWQNNFKNLNRLKVLLRYRVFYTSYSIAIIKIYKRRFVCFRLCFIEASICANYDNIAN